MKTYQELRIEVLQLQGDIVTTSNGCDNIVAGNSGWTGWGEGGLDK